MTTFLLKFLALIFMVVDHVGYFFMGATEYYETFRCLGRIAFPIFMFLVIVGAIKTSNKKKYLTRLAIFSGITFIGNHLLMLWFNNSWKIDSNIFLTMFLNAFIVCLIENRKNIKKILIVLGIIISTVLIHFVDYGYLSLTISIAYYLYIKNPKNLSKVKNNLLFLIYGSLSMIIGTFINYWGSETVIAMQLFMLLSLPLIMMYNGKLGLEKNTFFYKFQKYFFYIFYITHIWIFYIINFVRLGG